MLDLQFNLIKENKYCTSGTSVTLLAMSLNITRQTINICLTLWNFKTKWASSCSGVLSEWPSIHRTRVLALCRPRQDVGGHCTIWDNNTIHIILKWSCVNLMKCNSAFCCVFFHPDTWAQIVIPQTSIAVIQGEMVVLKVSYRTDPSHDLSTDTILWNFVSNKTQLVRLCFGGKVIILSFS